MPTLKQPFVGREWALARIDTWLRGEGQCMLITGLPGTGKTALSRQLARIHCRRPGVFDSGRIAAAHYCRPLDPSRTDPLRFVERLSKAIAYVHEPYRRAILNLGDTHIEVHGTATVTGPGVGVAGVRIAKVQVAQLSGSLAFERLVRGPLSQVGSPDPPVVVLVDALDEALTLKADETLVDLIAHSLSSGALPTGFRFLLTSRPDDRVLARFPSATASKFDLISDAPANFGEGADGLDDVGSYALLRLTAAGAKGAKSLAHRVSSAAEGNFLYAKYVLDEAIAADDLALSFTGLPHGLNALYREYLERELVRARESWEDRYRPLLGALAVARGDGLTREQLAQVANVRTSQVEDALLRLSQYVTAPRSEGPYRIFHQSFRDFLVADGPYQVYASEANGAVAEYALAAWASDWLACNDAYAIDNVVDHLVDAVQTEERPRARASTLSDLRSLVTDLTYLASRAHASGTAYAEADIAKAAGLIPEDGRLLTLRRQFAQIRPLVEQTPTARDAAATLATRLAHVPELQSLVGDLIGRIQGVTVTARHPLPDRAHPALIRAVDLPSPAVECAITANGNLVAGLVSGELIVLDVVTGTELRRKALGTWNAFALSADGQAAALTLDDGRVEIWDCGSGQKRRTIPGRPGPVAAIAISADGTFVVVAGQDGHVDVWHSGIGKRVGGFREAREISDCAVAMDGSAVVYLSVDGPLSARILGTEAPFVLTRDANAFALSADGTTALVAEGTQLSQNLAGNLQSTDGREDVSAGASGEWLLTAIDVRSRHRSVITRIDGFDDAMCAISGDGRRAAVADPYRELVIWDAAVGQLVVLEASHPTPLSLLALSADGKYVVSAVESQLSIWDADTRQERPYAEGRNTWALSSFRAGTRLLCAVREEGAEIWDVDRDAHLDWLTKSLEPLVVCAAGEDGNVAVTAEGLFQESVKVWDLEEHRLLDEVPSTGAPIALSRDGRLLFVTRDDRPSIWNIRDSRYETDVLGAAKPGMTYGISPDGSIAVIGHADGRLEVWSNLRRQVRSSARHEDRILDIGFRSDGQEFITSSADGTVRVWDTEGQELHLLLGHADWVRGCALSPDGRRAASVDAGGCVKIWELADNRCLLTQYVHGVLFDCEWLGDAELACCGTRGVYFFTLRGTQHQA